MFTLRATAGTNRAVARVTPTEQTSATRDCASDESATACVSASAVLGRGWLVDGEGRDQGMAGGGERVSLLLVHINKYVLAS